MNLVRAFFFGGLGGMAVGLVGYSLKEGIESGFTAILYAWLALGVTIGVCIVLIVRRVKKMKKRPNK